MTDPDAFRLARRVLDENAGLAERWQAARELAVLLLREEGHPADGWANLDAAEQHLRRAREYLRMPGDGRHAAELELFLLDISLYAQTYVLPSEEEWEAAIRKAKGEE